MIKAGNSNSESFHSYCTKINDHTQEGGPIQIKVKRGRSINFTNIGKIKKLNYVQ